MVVARPLGAALPLARPLGAAIALAMAMMLQALGPTSQRVR